MSRIGNRRLSIPAGVTVDVKDCDITVKGPKGELSLTFSNLLNVCVEENEVVVKKVKDTKTANILSGTTNANINNMLKGVSEGFEKGLEAVGVGYRFNVSGNKINISAGFSHPVEMVCPEGIGVEAISNTEIKIFGIAKQKVNEFAAKIRGIRPPEPYKGKGIRYKGEHVRRKEGKKAAK